MSIIKHKHKKKKKGFLKMKNMYINQAVLLNWHLFDDLIKNYQSKRIKVMPVSYQ